ncbi:phospholipid scramblase [Plakobranchus ocellatus]|uniref:Phospholipid scramblase n=1 Tax=Plakobranchus ocellatus TaxID=259542 RepID=A0AAV4BIV6_9GAST|nr:phospholipid scramblase [Plakobranchus ocellatus]
MSFGTVTQQPGQGPNTKAQFSNMRMFQPMAFPGQIPGVPTGLEYLSSVDQLIVKHEIRVLEYKFEVMSGFETLNTYRILNSLNQQAYWVFEGFQALLPGQGGGEEARTRDRRSQRRSQDGLLSILPPTPPSIHLYIIIGWG